MRKIYFITADKWGWTIEDTDKVEFYMLEYMFEDLEEKLKDEEKQHKKQEGEYKKQSKLPSSPKGPSSKDVNYGGFKVPKIPTPKIPTPKF